MIEFKQITEFLDSVGIVYRSPEEWKLYLPRDTSREKVQSIINKCRDLLLTNWHIIYPDYPFQFADEPDPAPPPDIFIYWDVKSLGDAG